MPISKEIRARIDHAIDTQNSEELLRIAAELPDDDAAENFITRQPTTIGRVRLSARESAKRLMKALGTS